MSRVFKSLIISLFSTFVALAIVEVGVRATLSSSRIGWTDRPIFYFGAEGRPSLQGPAYDPVKPNGIFRIAVVGDSFSFAPYMQFTDTFSAKLEQMLNLNATKEKAEVINYGVPAYSTSHEVAVVDQALREGADLVILQVTLNDPELKAHTPTGIQENMDDRFGPLKLSGTTEKICRYWKTLRFVLERIHNTQTHRAYREYFSGLFENQKTWVPYRTANETIVKKVADAHIPLVSVVFPLFGLPLDKNYPFSAAHQKVLDMFKEFSVAALDLSPMYEGIPLERLQVIPGGDRHPNEIAHRMAAERLYLWLEELKLIPQKFLIEKKFATRLGISGQRER